MQRAMFKDFSTQAMTMGLLAAFVGCASSFAVIVQGLTAVADCFIILTVNSDPQMKAVMNSIREGMREVGVGILRTEGDFHGGWVLLDYNDIIVHLFRKDPREFYDLDGVWADAPLIELDLEMPLP
jgi:ribosome-associated protein